MKYFFTTGLVINTSRFAAIAERTHIRRSSTSLGKGVQVVSDEVLAETRNDECQCEDVNHMAALGYQPLHAGMLVRGGLSGLNTTDGYIEGIGSGCTKGKYVCPRLDKVRRRYGV